MKKRQLNRFWCILAALFMGVLWTFGGVKNVYALAESSTVTVKNYDETPIEEDLQDIDTLLYFKNPSGEPQILRFQEYCYSDKPFYADHYGLYVYIYNPTEEPLKEDRNYNKINMATKYNAQGEPYQYDNVRLTFLDKSDNCRFYKFKVSGASDFFTMAKSYAAKHDGVRRYDVVGIELQPNDGSLPIKDTSHSMTYRFTGFAAGLGTSETTDSSNSDSSAGTAEESTLKCTVEGLETISLNVGHANYRTGDYKNYVCDELNTVYFSVPEKYFTEYGGLQKIKAEWYEYKTKPIFVTSDENSYRILKDYIGVDLGTDGVDKTLDTSVFFEETLGRVSTAGGPAVYYAFGNVYNDNLSAYDISERSEYYRMATDYKTVNRMDWLLQATENDIDSNDDYKVPADQVEEYMRWYTQRGWHDVLCRKYANTLFEDSIDADRLSLLEGSETNGYIMQEIDAEDEQGLLFEKKQSWWDKIWKGTKYETENISPIVELSANDVIGRTATSFAEEYKISDEYAETVYSAATKATKNGENRFVLFRFAVTDYYASKARFDKTGDDSWAEWNMSSVDGYVAQQTMFFDFNVISLTFRNEGGEDKVIGVVADPVDIINGLDPAPDVYVPDDWLDKFIAWIQSADFAGDLLSIVLIVVFGIFAWKAFWAFVDWLFKGA